MTVKLIKNLRNLIILNNNFLTNFPIFEALNKIRKILLRYNQKLLSLYTKKIKLYVMMLELLKIITVNQDLFPLDNIDL